MDTTEQIAQLFENMGYIVDFISRRTIELIKPDGSDWTDRELDELYDEAGNYDSVRVSPIYDDRGIAQVEIGV